ncbi:MAG: hypothetical protein LBU64_02100 [Planctomycetota bacterium]|nr:hypothetical protein [Planctomycetota bacterium]
MAKFRCAFIVWLLAALPAVSGAFPAEEAGSRLLPERLGLVVSVESLDGLIDRLDEFMAAATAGTPNHVPPGFLRLRLGMTLASPEHSPLRLLPMDRELQLLIPPSGRSFALLFRADSREDFLLDLGEPDIAAEDDGPDGAIVSFPNQELYVLEVAGGRIAVGLNRGDIEDALGLDRGGPTFPPDHPTGSQVRVVASRSLLDNLPDRPSALFRKYLEGETAKFNDMALESLGKGLTIVNRLGLDAGALLNLAQKTPPIAIKRLIGLVAELEKSESLRLDLRLDGERLAVAWGLETAADSFLGRLAASLAGRDKVETDLARRIGGEAVTVQVDVPVPELSRALANLAGDLLEPIFPEIREALDRVGRTADLAGASSFHFDSGGGHGLVLRRATDPEAALAALTDLFPALDRLLAKFFVSSPADIAVTAEPDPANSGTIFRLAVNPDSQLAGFIRELGEKNPDALPDPDLFGYFQGQYTFVGLRDGLLVTLQASSPEAIHRALAEDLNPNGAPDPLVSRPQARRIIEEFRHAQGSIILISPDNLFDGLKNLLLSAPPRLGPELEDLRNWTFDASGQLLGLGLGADSHGLVLEEVIPVKLLNAILLLSAEISGGDGEEDADEGEDDWEDYGEGEEPEGEFEGDG